ncbi:MAG: hypothetical protein M5U12_25515 [Verrucomicrobia bacterium]|nr:hypothetical protein [Verrucomicrobiota bacterium]
MVALIVNLQAQLLLPPGNPAGTMTATLPGGPVGHIAFHSSSATPDDAGNFTAQVHSAVTVGNSFGLETLTFWYQVTNMDQIPNGSPLVSLGIPMPAAAAVIVDQSNSGRLASLALNTGSSVSLFWTVNPINEGQFSAWLSMETPHIFLYDKDNLGDRRNVRGGRGAGALGGRRGFGW